jgi:hypothetical protein
VQITLGVEELIRRGVGMPRVRVLDYFCRVEGEELVCVARVAVNGRYVSKEFREGLGSLLEKESGDEGALGC